MAIRGYCYSRCWKNSCSCINILVKMSSALQQKTFKIRSSPSYMFYKKEILKNLVKFIEKQLFLSFLFNKVIGSEAITWRCSVKKSVHKNLAKFTGKHLCHSFKYQASGLQPFQKRDSDTGVFLWISCEVIQTLLLLQVNSQVRDNFWQMKTL